MKKLKAPKTSSRKLFARVKYLQDNLGPILFQLPPHWRLNFQRLRTFLESLPGDRLYAFEFREQSWFTDEVYELLQKHNAALCLYHMTGYDSPLKVTADFVYVRMHGTESKYGGSYPANMLKTWSKRINRWVAESKAVYFYFNNDPEGHAVKNAITLRELI